MVKILDCTLRDGGYVNDWNFSRENVINVFNRLKKSNIEFVEIGFLDERRPYNIDKTILPESKSIDENFKNFDKGKTQVAAMIDYGTCSIDNVEKCEDSFIDCIRVIFKKHNLKNALEFCKKLKDKGYKVFVQLVSITDYTKDDIKEACKLLNNLMPFCVSIVDTYGLLYPEEMNKYYAVLNANLDKNITIGLHTHNNLQLAYANCLAFIANNDDREKIVDGSLYGIGKSAGNCPVELLAMYLNDKQNKNYNIDSILEAIDESIMPIYNKNPWGYKTFFYLCSKNRCHPNYLKDFIEKKNLSVSKLDNLLSKIENDKIKLYYDKEYADKIYNEYIMSEISDDNNKKELYKELKDKKILIVGPGKNIIAQKKNIDKFIKENNPYVISINHVPENINIDMIFITNNIRYHQLSTNSYNGDLNKVKILALTNIEENMDTFDFVINRAPYLDNNEKITDNSFVMLVKLLKEIGIKEINCAGLDGYSEEENNYCNPSREYSFIKNEANYINKYVKEFVLKMRKDMVINFVTYSSYDETENINSAMI